MKNKWWMAIPALVSPVSAAVGGEYLSEDEVQKVFFPSAVDFVLAPSPSGEVLARAARSARAAGWDRPPRVREARGPGGNILGRVVVDQVIGKHDYITFAVGLSTSGEVVGVEILNYREAYGGDVRHERWRKQFVGRKPGDSLKFPVDIRNIAGATLSCRHVTDGVRRILALPW